MFCKRSQAKKYIEKRICELEKLAVLHLPADRVKRIQDEVKGLFFEVFKREEETGIKKPTFVEIDNADAAINEESNDKPINHC